MKKHLLLAAAMLSLAACKKSDNASSSSTPALNTWKIDGNTYVASSVVRSKDALTITGSKGGKQSYAILAFPTMPNISSKIRLGVSGPLNVRAFVDSFGEMDCRYQDARVDATVTVANSKLNVVVPSVWLYSYTRGVLDSMRFECNIQEP